MFLKTSQEFQFHRKTPVLETPTQVFSCETCEIFKNIILVNICKRLLVKPVYYRKIIIYFFHKIMITTLKLLFCGNSSHMWNPKNPKQSILILYLLHSLKSFLSLKKSVEVNSFQQIKDIATVFLRRIWRVS